MKKTLILIAILEIKNSMVRITQNRQRALFSPSIRVKQEKEKKDVQIFV